MNTIAKIFKITFCCFALLCFTHAYQIYALGAGEVDPGFNAGVSRAGAIGYVTAIQPDGKILVGGDFTVAGATAKSQIARFNADGTIDSSFDVDFGGMPGIVRTVYARITI